VARRVLTLAAMARGIGRNLVAAIVLAVVGVTSDGRADELDEPPARVELPIGSYVGLPSPEEAKPYEVSLRLEVAERLLERQRDYASLWWRGWLSFYSVGLVVQGTRATFEDDPAVRADLVISAVKATGGIIRYVAQPYLGIEGTEAIGPLPAGTLAERRVRLARAEEILRENARVTDARRVWWAHLVNIAVNAAGGLIVAFAFDDPQTGFVSAGIGAAVGEVSLLTQPWQADDDWEDYRSHFSGERDPEETARFPARPPRVTISPGPFGGQLEVVF
jgi:hypothetical protein